MALYSLLRDRMEKLQQIIEAALMVAGRPLTVAAIQKLFDEDTQPTTAEIRTALQDLRAFYTDRGIELSEVSSGWQFRSCTEFSPWLAKLWDERPQRYSRALLETLALVAWRQPITRAEIEDIRGVTVSSHIMRTLLEREWVRVLGYRDLPGKPALYGTTKTFLDHFHLKSLEDLPPLPEFSDPENHAAPATQKQVQLELTQFEETTPPDETTIEQVSLADE
ncbi:MAG: SMC-Scp complex subunit ScpB [Gammaproteobacteria bacterium]|nr:SMC-Scp complex subunit ScpB [Gammaproteobacteria bacterium]